MAAFIIGDVRVENPERYRDYTAHTEATLEPYGGHFVVRGGASTVLEGEWQPNRLVVIEFPSAQAAKDWYGSEAYRQIIPIRQEASTGSLVLVEGHGA